MGESPATYHHADAVAALTLQVIGAYPTALARARAVAPVLQHAVSSAHRPSDLTMCVTVFRELASTELAELPDPMKAANDVMTAALYLASGIDYAATSVEIYQIPIGSYRIRFTSGPVSEDIPVPPTPVQANTLSARAGEVCADKSA